MISCPRVRCTKSFSLRFAGWREPGGCSARTRGPPGIARKPVKAPGDRPDEVERRHQVSGPGFGLVMRRGVSSSPAPIGAFPLLADITDGERAKEQLLETTG